MKSTAQAPPRRRYVPLVVAPALTMLLLFALVPGTEERAFLAREDGEIEIATVIAYFACIAFGIRYGKAEFFARCWYMPALLLVMALRELDFDKRFTTMGILKSAFYLNPDVSLMEKTLGLIIVAFVVSLVLILIKRHLSGFVAGWRSGHFPSLAFGTALFFLVVSKSMDGLPRKLADVGLSVTERVVANAMLIEEVLELGVPLLLGLAIWASFARPAR